MNGLLFTTVWLSLTLFVVAEFGKPRLIAGRGAHAFWWISAAGLALGIVHVFLALWINNDWNHAIAWRVTEERTREMFGIGWGGLLAGNYAFLGWWAFDLWRWRSNPAAYAATPPLILWGARAFVLGIIAPAAIVFAAGPRRWLGVALVVAMIAGWLRTPRN
jgi:hypothetical protein